MHKAINIAVIIVLVVIACGLGYLIYLQNHPKTSPTNAVSQNIPQQTQPNSTKLPASVTTPPVDVLTALKFPDEKTSDKDKKIFFDSVHTLAQDVSQAEIKNCTLVPPVVKIQNGKQLQLKNTDPGEHKITVSTTTTTYTLPASGSVTVTASFSKGVGVYGLRCDQGKTISGILDIVK